MEEIVWTNGGQPEISENPLHPIHTTNAVLPSSIFWAYPAVNVKLSQSQKHIPAVHLE